MSEKVILREQLRKKRNFLLSGIKVNQLSATLPLKNLKSDLQKSFETKSSDVE